MEAAEKGSDEKKELQKRYLVWTLLSISHGIEHVRAFTQSEMEHDYEALKLHFLKRCCGLTNDREIEDSVEAYKERSVRYTINTGQNVKGGTEEYPQVKFHPGLFYYCSKSADFCQGRLELDEIN